MAAFIDERGPYVLELASNADARHDRQKRSGYWSDNLFVDRNGQCAYVPLGGGNVVFYYPHEGEGEPRPKS